ncbi:methylmalonyl-CoA mutase subunit beta [Alsobacter sp. SYSU M60028]|uniref:Methylmalonyl-CoA mutase subunit beta n=1 Tax=Alsobacter ponti TaxID=2962936 RepID=A0ABT1L8K0_9HYPH|nr:methylmalonyl-CoA mutase subunit beta [Alsobacter ponti]MCP8937831.1 methylmalonyl-CoA mutase subunit beta [Alsobacter ponti]
MAELSIASAFPAATRDQWLKLVEGVLKGAPFERKLVSTTYDGVAVQPLYPKAEGRGPIAGRAAGRPWAVLSCVEHPDPAQANALALEELENGATGLHLVFAGSQGAHGFGLPSGDAATLARVLDGVVLEAGISLSLNLSLATKDAATSLADLCDARGLDPAALDVSFGFDPLGQMALMGGTPVEWPQLAPMVAELAASFPARGFNGPVLAADGRAVHAAGGSEAQELAFALSAAIAYLRALEAGGMPLDAAARLIGFRLAADADQILTLAKFRALRLLWARATQACGLPPARAHLHGETAWRMLTRRDPWVNLLRETVAVFAAGVGGADAVSVLPFTSALGLPDAFARRLARNTQLVLLEESNLFRVADPAAGSGGIEAMTDALAEAGWAGFQAIEKQGGLFAALASGAFQSEVAKVRAARAKAVATRRDPLTGASEFPDIAEKPVHVLAPAPAPAPASGQWPSLAPMRLAEPYEALRDAADDAEAKGRRPAVFLANLGPISAFTARATFAKNLFEAGGVAALGNDGFAREGGTDLAALVEAFGASGAKAACLCSSDDVYASDAAAAARALKAAGAARVWLAGRAGEHEAAWREAGVDGFVFAGMDVLAALRDAHEALLGAA